MFDHLSHEVRDTSLFNWFDIRDRISEKRAVVYSKSPDIGDPFGATAWEIARKCDLPITSVRPRLTELVKKYGLIEELNDRRRCPICNKMCIAYRKRY